MFDSLFGINFRLGSWIYYILSLKIFVDLNKFEVFKSVVSLLDEKCMLLKLYLLKIRVLKE